MPEIESESTHKQRWVALAIKAVAALGVLAAGIAAILEAT